MTNLRRNLTLLTFVTGATATSFASEADIRIPDLSMVKFDGTVSAKTNMKLFSVLNIERFKFAKEAGFDFALEEGD